MTSNVEQKARGGIWRANEAYTVSLERVEALPKLDSERTKPYGCLDSMRGSTPRIAVVVESSRGLDLNDGAYQISEEGEESLGPRTTLWDGGSQRHH